MPPHISNGPEPAEIARYQIIKIFNMMSGAARGIRTPDPLITNEVLYQLSYCGPS
jgi:hypothetical protein